ncbi:MAG: peroxiredoxin [Rhodocyclales bacterium]|nr:peroxiredoxin [Rhodocyclales bacterium]
MLQPGQQAPMFSLPDADMEDFDLASLRGKQHAVVFFYPKDGTPYCTREAIEFSDHEAEFNRHSCVILGISRDDCLAHAEFRDKNGLSVRLLSDVDGTVGHKYGVYHYREQDGHKKLVVSRSTFIIDKQGIIRHAFYEVPTKGHAAEVFQLVKQLNGSRQPCKSQKTP